MILLHISPAQLIELRIFPPVRLIEDGSNLLKKKIYLEVGELGIVYWRNPTMKYHYIDHPQTTVSAFDIKHSVNAYLIDPIQPWHYPSIPQVQEKASKPKTNINQNLESHQNSPAVHLPVTQYSWKASVRRYGRANFPFGLRLDLVNASGDIVGEVPATDEYTGLPWVSPGFCPEENGDLVNWREMYITDPPITSVRVFFENRFKHRSREITNPQGVKGGDIEMWSTGVKRVAHASERAGNRTDRRRPFRKLVEPYPVTGRQGRPVQHLPSLGQPYTTPNQQLVGPIPSFLPNTRQTQHNTSMAQLNNNQVQQYPTVYTRGTGRGLHQSLIQQRMSPTQHCPLSTNLVPQNVPQGHQYNNVPQQGAVLGQPYGLGQPYAIPSFRFSSTNPYDTTSGPPYLFPSSPYSYPSQKFAGTSRGCECVDDRGSDTIRHASRFPDSTNHG